MTVEDIDFDFENSLVKIVMTREVPEMPGFQRLSSVRVGQEVEMPYWTAQELVQSGYAKFRDDPLNYSMISKVHWRETIPASRQLPSLQPNFYCFLRRHLSDLREASRQDQVKSRELERTESLVRDIVNCRVRKIVSLAASPTLSEELIRSLTYEERSLYSLLNRTIGEWKSRLLVESKGS